MNCLKKLAIAACGLMAVSCQMLPAIADDSQAFEPQTNAWSDFEPHASMSVQVQPRTMSFSSPGTVRHLLLPPTTTGTVPGFLPVTSTANIVDLNVVEEPDYSNRRDCCEPDSGNQFDLGSQFDFGGGEKGNRGTRRSN